MGKEEAVCRVGLIWGSDVQKEVGGLGRCSQGCRIAGDGKNSVMWGEQRMCSGHESKMVRNNTVHIPNSSAERLICYSGNKSL